MYDFCISPLYAAVLLGGGLYGYATKGSVESLGALLLFLKRSILAGRATNAPQRGL
jgi:hypothetical protein